MFLLLLLLVCLALLIHCFPFGQSNVCLPFFSCWFSWLRICSVVQVVIFITWNSICMFQLLDFLALILRHPAHPSLFAPRLPLGALRSCALFCCYWLTVPVATWVWSMSFWTCLQVSTFVSMSIVMMLSIYLSYLNSSFCLPGLFIFLHCMVISKHLLLVDPLDSQDFPCGFHSATIRFCRSHFPALLTRWYFAILILKWF